MCQPGRPGGSPDSHCGSPGPRALPQHEVARVFLLVLVGIDAGAALDAAVIETRELAVLGEGRNLEVDRAIALVGMAVLLERLDHPGHRRNVIGGARRELHRLEAQRGGVLLERLDELLRVFAQRLARLHRLDDRPIVHVGVIADLLHRVALGLERAAEDVQRDERPEISDVPPRVHGEAARVHPDGLALRRDERFFPPGEGIE